MMSFRVNHKGRVRSFLSDESGTTLVEFAFCVALFLLILFAVLDFGRLGYQWVSAEKGMQVAVRLAAVRPPVCNDVPLYHRADPLDTSGAGAGTLCRTGTGSICEKVTPKVCTLGDDNLGTEGQATATEIWGRIQNLVPEGTTADNILLTYRYDERLGFLGGPYVPVISAELIGGIDEQGAPKPLPFEFVTPLSALAATAGAANASDANYFPESFGTCSACIPFPAINATLPAEDMNQGIKG